MPETMVIWQHDVFPERTVKVDLPLTDKIDYENVRSDLGVPRHLDMNCFLIRKAAVVLWASKHARELHELYSEAVKKMISKKPLRLLLLGGCATKWSCPSANVPGSLFNRRLNDVDCIVRMDQRRDVEHLLLALDSFAGTMYMHFVTPYEEQYNTVQAERLLVRTFNKVSEKGIPEVGIMDILVNRVEMRHTVDIGEDLKNEEINHTISLHNLLLTKLQYIMDLPKEDTLPKLEMYGDIFRILPHKHFSSARVLIGMETKDLLDVACILLDHDFGERPSEINLGKMKAKLKDDKFRMTVRLNLQNLVNNLSVLEKLGCAKSDLEKIGARAQRILNELPETDYKWSKPWWNTDVEAPETRIG
jgi:hypothetical protein